MGLISNDHNLQLIAIAIKTIPIKAPVHLVYKLQLLEFVKKALIAISSVAFQGLFYGFFQLNYSIYRVPEVEESQRLAGVLESGYICYISSRNSIMGIPFGMYAILVSEIPAHGHCSAPWLPKMYHNVYYVNIHRVPDQ